MTVALGPVNLSGVVTGQSGTIDLTPTNNQNSPYALQSGVNAHLQMFNDSGVGLSLLFAPSGDTEYLPAGAWRSLAISPSDITITYTALYTLNNPPVSLLLAVYYMPGEEVPDIGQLGNSPIGVSGTVTTTGVQTLTNDGNPAGTQLIEAKQSGSTGSNVSIDNSGDFSIQQFVASTLTTILQTIAGVSAGGSNVKLSDANHQAEVLGTLLVDSHIISPNNTTQQIKNATGTARDVLKVFTDNDLYIIATPDNGNFKVSNSAQNAAIATFNDTAGLTLGVGNFTLNGSALVTVNGSVSGSYTIYTPIWGSTLKVMVVAFNNYNSAGAAVTNLPSTANFGFYAVGNIGTATCSLQMSGVAQTVSQISAIGTGAGSSVGTTTMKANSIGQLVSNANQFQSASGNFGTTVFVFVGV